MPFWRVPVLLAGYDTETMVAQCRATTQAGVIEQLTMYVGYDFRVLLLYRRHIPT